MSTRRGKSIVPLRDRPDGPFAENLTHALLVRGMTAADVAARLGEITRRVQRQANATTLPHYYEIPAIARVLHLPPEHLAWMPVIEFQAAYPRRARS